MFHAHMWQLPVRALPLAAATTDTFYGQIGQLLGYVLIGGLIIASIAFVPRAIRSNRANAEEMRLLEEQRKARTARAAAPIPVRIRSDDTASWEERSVPRAELADHLALLVSTTAASAIELRVPGRGIVTIGIDGPDATLGWNTAGGSYRFDVVSTKPTTNAPASDPDDKYRLSRSDAVAIIHAWLDNADTRQFGEWTREPHATDPRRHEQ